MPTTDDVNGVLQRVGMIALFYYPEVHLDDPEYNLRGDIDWCIETLEDVSEADLGPIRDVVGRAIIDPTSVRQELFVTLVELAPREADQRSSDGV